MLDTKQYLFRSRFDVTSLAHRKKTYRPSKLFYSEEKPWSFQDKANIITIPFHVFEW